LKSPPVERGSGANARAAARGGAVLVCALLASLGLVSCRRGKAPAGASATGGAAPAEPMEPSIRAAPEAGRPPFSGMKEPRDAALDGKGRLWVADFGNSRLRLFDADGGYLGGWGGKGSGRFAFNEPCGVAVHAEDVYVADTWNSRIERFSSQGEWKGSAGNLYGPRGVAVSLDGKVWVSDTGNHRLVVYDPDLTRPRVFGKEGRGRSRFSSPVGIVGGPSGSVFVADTGNRRIQVFDADGSFQREVSVPGWTGGAEPALEVGADEKMYATDPVAEVVLELDRGGLVRRRWTHDERGERLSIPTGLALDRSRGLLYVVNSGSDRVAIFHLSRKARS